MLCASPAYLARYGAPREPSDLARQIQSIRIHGNLCANDGEIAVAWTLDGHGIIMRAE